MNEVTPELVEELKERLHISHSGEDNSLGRMIKSSIAALITRCGSFDIHTNDEAKELVFERVRYQYNDSLEFFDENFLSSIHSLGFSLLPYEEETT